MSIKISSRVWEHSKQSGAKKLLLLALADHANDDGIAWPGATKLADKINQSERHTRRLLQELEIDGDIVCKQGGGRGHQTLYGILVGMTDEQNRKVNSVLQNTVVQNSVPGVTVSKKTVTSPHTNSDIQGTETVTFSNALEVPFTAPERGKSTVVHNDNRHGTVMEPEEGHTHASKTAPQPDPLATAALALCNFRNPNKPQQQAISQLVSYVRGYEATPERLAGFGEWWRTKSVAAKMAARDGGRQVTVPTPDQVEKYWPEFDVKRTPTASATPPPPRPAEPVMTPEEFAAKMRAMPVPDFVTQRRAAREARP